MMVSGCVAAAWPGYAVGFLTVNGSALHRLCRLTLKYQGAKLPGELATRPPARDRLAAPSATGPERRPQQGQGEVSSSHKAAATSWACSEGPISSNHLQSRPGRLEHRLRDLRGLPIARTSLRENPRSRLGISQQRERAGQAFTEIGVELGGFQMSPEHHHRRNLLGSSRRSG